MLLLELFCDSGVRSMLNTPKGNRFNLEHSATVICNTRAVPRSSIILVRLHNKSPGMRASHNANEAECKTARLPGNALSQLLLRWLRCSSMKLIY